MAVCVGAAEGEGEGEGGEPEERLFAVITRFHKQG